MLLYYIAHNAAGRDGFPPSERAPRCALYYIAHNAAGRD